MTIDQATIDAVNVWLANQAFVCNPRNEADREEVAALLFALAKCEPVRGLVEALQFYAQHRHYHPSCNITGFATGQIPVKVDGGKTARAALTLIAEGGGM